MSTPEVLPHDLDAEQAVLGCLLIDPKAIGRVRDALAPADFYTERNGCIFKAVSVMAARGEPVDILTLKAQLERDGKLAMSGGIEYLAKLSQKMPTAASVRSYAQIVVDHAVRRALGAAGVALSQAASNGTWNAADAVATVEQSVADARRRLLDTAGAARLTRRLDFKTAAERAAETPPRIDWVINGLAAVGLVSELDGSQKTSGKTTLIAWAVRAKLDGALFLGRPTVAGPVVWLTEESWASLQEPLRDAGLLGRDDLYLLCREDAFGIAWEAVARQAREKAIETGAKLVVADTLASLAGLKGDEENSSGAALVAVRPVQEMAAAGIAVLVARHDRRAGGEVGESGRGSTAFAGAADLVFRLTRLPGEGRPTLRQLDYVGRARGVPERLVIELTTNGYQTRGTVADIKRQEARELLLDHLPDGEEEAVTLPSLWLPANPTKGREGGPLDGSKVGKTTFRDAAESLLRDGLVARREISARKQVWWCVSGTPRVTGHAAGVSSVETGAADVSGCPSPFRDGHTGHTATDEPPPDTDDDLFDGTQQTIPETPSPVATAVRTSPAAVVPLRPEIGSPPTYAIAPNDRVPAGAPSAEPAATDGRRAEENTALPECESQRRVRCEIHGEWHEQGAPCHYCSFVARGAEAPADASAAATDDGARLARLADAAAINTRAGR